MHDPRSELSLTRRDLLGLGLSAAAIGPALGSVPDARTGDVHRELLDLAERQQARRRERFAVVATKADLEALQKTLREAFLGLLDGLPTAEEPPPARAMGRIDGDGYTIEKLAFESFPGYFVTALLYRPTKLDGPAPGILSPCGHSTVGKAEPTYQILHINLAKRGYVVLTYDPVGQGERSQFWDADRDRSRFNLSCGEHAVLGNPLYLLGTNLARYRIWDGLRALDYLTTRPAVDKERIGCVGNSGGGTLTAYLAALDPRIVVPVIGCYITTLPRRMGNRIQEDPSSDPEQDIADFVSRGIDHAGLLALTAPRPTLICAAQRDFFPIEGTRETFAEAKALYRAAGAEDRIDLVEAPQRHGLTLPLREATYAWFDRWLMKRDPRAEEIAVTPRSAMELQVCPEGQVGPSLRSRPLLTIALEEFRARGKRPRVALKDLDLLRVDSDRTEFRLDRIAAGRDGAPLVVCLDGNESPSWRTEEAFLDALKGRGYSVTVVAPRGVGPLRPDLKALGHKYEDPLGGVEANLAYNAFLAGQSLLGLRVADVLAAVESIAPRPLHQLVLCARRDAALVACLAAAVEPRIGRLAVEELPATLFDLFDPEGRPINAASILPGLLRDFGDIPDVLAAVAPREILLAAPRGKLDPRPASARVVAERFSDDAGRLLEWLR
jgi:dienelactone hydrolase